MSGKEGNYSFSPALFTDEMGNSLLFVIKPCKAKETLRDMIKYGGGEVVSTPGDHGITLIPPEVEVTGIDEVYSTDYIKDCCTRNRLQDLKPYRLNAASQFPDNFDVMDVLLKYTSWSAALKGLPFERKLYPVHSSPSNSSYYSDDTDDDESQLLHPSTSGLEIQHHFQKTEQTIRRTEPRDSETEFEKSEDSLELEEVVPKVIEESEVEIERSGDEDTNTRSSRRQLRNLRTSKINSCRETQTAKASSSNPEGEVVSDDDDDELWSQPTKRVRAGLMIRRRDYTRKEKLAIINFITKYRCHNYVKGREMWQKAEAAQICPGRTWQSLKEHFIKKIIPNIESYDLSEEELCKFQKPEKRTHYVETVPIQSSILDRISAAKLFWQIFMKFGVGILYKMLNSFR